MAKCPKCGTEVAKPKNHGKWQVVQIKLESVCNWK
jgi:hypothetical protein